jgi:hypothetical protein
MATQLKIERGPYRFGGQYSGPVIGGAYSLGAPNTGADAPTLEHAKIGKQMAANASTHTTRLFDRHEDCVTLDGV